MTDLHHLDDGDEDFLFNIITQLWTPQPVRYVCQNTLQAAESSGPRHRGRVTRKKSK